MMKLHDLLGLLLIIFSGIAVSNELNYSDLVFVVLSQGDKIHATKALMLKSELLAQTNNESKIYITHKDLKHMGDWTVLPVLKRLWVLEKGKFSWTFFCTDQTKINVKNLMSTIKKYNSKDILFVGKALQDIEPTIIHHFTSIPAFNYPLFAAGFGFNSILFERLMHSMNGKKIKDAQFSIDASHELALLIKNNLNNTFLVNNPHFCLKFRKDCATYVTNEEFCEELNLENIFFAVKTCKKFHKDRIPVVQATWGKRAHHIAYFSESYDENIPTVKLNVPNTERGHCGKTKAIFSMVKKYLTDNNNNLKWVVLTDDDTILSVRRIQKLVGCYDPDIPYILGERYGFDVYSNNGYNYITGGGGAVLSRAAVIKLSSSICDCPTDSTPDDMYLLGICIQKLNIELVHIPLFHQARPDDYSPDYLEIGAPISFHKHWMTDPVQIYEKWFGGFDRQNYVHTEL